jgi:hypothetical protein
MRHAPLQRPSATTAAVAALAFGASLLTACDGPGAGAGPDQAAGPTAPHLSHAAPAAARQTDGALGPGVHRALAALRAATARFHSLETAQAAGYRTRVTECMSDPAAGGMGVHYADLGRFDATVDALRPEILVYAPGPNDRLRLVAVEYAVPLAAWSQAEPPSLYGIPFHVNAAFGLWVLHAWVWTPNPSGMFADWNPRVSCGAS